MKFHKFEEEFPQDGSNILVSTPDKKVGMIQFDKEAKRAVKNCLEDRKGTPFEVFVSNTNEDEDIFLGIENCPYWAYSTSIKLPK